MKFLLYDWEALTQKGLIKALEKLGHTVVRYNRKIENHILDEPFIRDLAVKLATDGIDVVISFNFFSQVSLACQAMKKIYLSWIYSCPHYYMETGAAYYEGNFFFVFDRNYANYFIQKGFPNVYHLPLAVDPEVFEHTEPLDRRYGYDVSSYFVSRSSITKRCRRYSGRVRSISISHFARSRQGFHFVCWISWDVEDSF